MLNGPEMDARLQHMLDLLNSRKIYWNNTGLDMGYGASWGQWDGKQETLQPLLGQLSWLAEQSCANHRVLALTHSQEVATGQTTERVLLLNKIVKRSITAISCFMRSLSATLTAKGTTRFLRG